MKTAYSITNNHLSRAIPKQSSSGWGGSFGNTIMLNTTTYDYEVRQNADGSEDVLSRTNRQSGKKEQYAGGRCGDKTILGHTETKTKEAN